MPFDWGKVNWYAFAPQLMSLYLVLMSGVASKYLRARVEQAAARGAAKDHATFVGNLAAGWATQLGFMNAMFAAIFSAFSIWSSTRSYPGVVATIVVLLLILIWMMWYLFTHEPDQLVSVTRSTWPRTTAATLCKGVLILVNVGLILATLTSQQMSAVVAGSQGSASQGHSPAR